LSPSLNAAVGLTGLSRTSSDNVGDPVKMYLEDIMSVPPSLAGLPAISVPAGKTSSGLPVGVQLIGQQRSDAQLLALAGSVEDK